MRGHRAISVQLARVKKVNHGYCRSFKRLLSDVIGRDLSDSQADSPVCKPDAARQHETGPTEGTGSVLSAKVTAPARDCPRRQRRVSYGS